jgi:hypothetical protein
MPPSQFPLTREEQYSWDTAFAIAFVKEVCAVSNENSRTLDDVLESLDQETRPELTARAIKIADASVRQLRNWRLHSPKTGVLV